MKLVKTIFVILLMAGLLGAANTQPAHALNLGRLIFGGNGENIDPTMKVNADVLGEKRTYPLTTSDGTLVVPRGVQIRVLVSANYGKDNRNQTMEIGVADPSVVDKHDPWRGFNVIFSEKTWYGEAVISTGNMRSGTHIIGIRTRMGNSVRMKMSTLTFSVGEPLPIGVSMDAFMSSLDAPAGTPTLPIGAKVGQPETYSSNKSSDDSFQIGTLGDDSDKADVEPQTPYQPIAPVKPAPVQPTVAVQEPAYRAPQQPDYHAPRTQEVIEMPRQYNGPINILGPAKTPIHVVVVTNGQAKILASGTISSAEHAVLQDLSPGQVVEIWLFGNAVKAQAGQHVKPDKVITIPEKFLGMTINIK